MNNVFITKHSIGKLYLYSKLLFNGEILQTHDRQYKFLFYVKA